VQILIIVNEYTPKCPNLFFEGETVGENPTAIFILKKYVQDIYKDSGG
jgi:hypothetical protein